MSTIDAAIIKALVDHVGGDSSGIPDGVIGGGKTYTAGDAIDLSNDKISVCYDANSMELKDGKIAAKTQNSAGQGISISANGVISLTDHQHTTLQTLSINQGLTAQSISTNAITPITASKGLTLSGGTVVIPDLQAHVISPSQSDTTIRINGELEIPTASRLNLGQYLEDVRQFLLDLKYRVEQLERA